MIRLPCFLLPFISTTRSSPSPSHRVTRFRCAEQIRITSCLIHGPSQGPLQTSDKRARGCLGPRCDTLSLTFPAALVPVSLRLVALLTPVWRLQVGHPIHRHRHTDVMTFLGPWPPLCSTRPRPGQVETGGTYIQTSSSRHSKSSHEQM